MNQTLRDSQVLKYLSINGPQSGKEVCNKIKISQATFSRLVKKLSSEIVVMGRGSTTIYAKKREIKELGSVINVLKITEEKSAEHVADLIPILPRGFYIKSKSSIIKSRLYEDLPYWLHDLRPSGYLGRLIAKKFSNYHFPEDPRNWSNDDCLRYWCIFGSDLIGNLIFSSEKFGGRISHIFENNDNSNFISEDQRAIMYPVIALNTLNYGHAGSSAAGEEPKFLVKKKLATDSPNSNQYDSLIVKFSSANDDELTKRKKELLVCEHLALKTLSDNKINSAYSELFEFEGRLFLEILRFDRDRINRFGLISLLSLDMEFIGSGSNWETIAKSLRNMGKISNLQYQEILFRYYFGILIGNTDMHSGNLSFFADGEQIIGLAPVYDMLPMVFAPFNNEIISPKDKIYRISKKNVPIFNKAEKISNLFWENVYNHNKISDGLKEDIKIWKESYKIVEDQTTLE